MKTEKMRYFLLRSTSIHYFSSFLDLFVFYLGQRRLYSDYASGVRIIGKITDFNTGEFEVIYSSRRLEVNDG